MKHAEETGWEGLAVDQQRQLWIDTLSHARHDWLNDLQLIIGYVQLRKYDKVTACVDMLKEKLAEEGKTVKLGHPGLIEALLTYQTVSRPFLFSVHIREAFDYRTAPHAGDAAEFALRRLLEGFEASAAKGVLGSDNTLDCTFDADSSEATLAFTYRGVYTESVLRKTVAEIQKQWRTSGSLGLQAEFEASEVRVMIRVSISG
jgi:stage 0 sporulation protein B (sporulation initiation phosphotransferase)